MIWSIAGKVNRRRNQVSLGTWLRPKSRATHLDTTTTKTSTDKSTYKPLLSSLLLLKPSPIHTHIHTLTALGFSSMVQDSWTSPKTQTFPIINLHSWWKQTRPRKDLIRMAAFSAISLYPYKIWHTPTFRNSPISCALPSGNVTGSNSRRPMVNWVFPLQFCNKFKSF